jgi:glycosyltransferase involved in cell wall biosynthesis
VRTGSRGGIGQVRILFLSRWLPYPADNGSKIRILNLLRILAAQHEVDLLAFASEDEATRQAAAAALGERCASVRFIPYRAFRPSSPAALRGLLSPWPRFLVDTFNRQMAAAVRARASICPPALVIASQLDMAPYALLTGAPALLEEIELSNYRDACERGKTIGQRLRAELTWIKLRAFLQRTLPRFAACTVVSQRERDYLQQAVPTYDRVAVIPNAVDLDRYQGDFGQPAINTLVHAGALSYQANLDAMQYFLGQIFPRVRAAVGQARLRVTGALPAGARAALPAAPGVDFTGYVTDIRPVIAQSWVSIAPLRLGGGTRLKILESMALGTPVVATPKGAEGLAVEDGRDILIGATPDDFARAVVTLLQSPALRARLAAAGRQRIETTYNWRSIGRDLCRLVETLPAAGEHPAKHAGRVDGAGGVTTGLRRSKRA